MSWPEKTSPTLDASEKRTLGEGVFKKCDGCGATVTTVDMAANFEVCPACSHHHNLKGAGRLCSTTVSSRAGTGSSHRHFAFSDGKPYPERIKLAEKRASRKSRSIGALASMAADRLRRVQLPVHGRQHGLRRRRDTRMFERATEPSCR
jgi:acetyl-CoA carboxylase carboxyl transferase subunit beta